MKTDMNNTKRLSNMLGAFLLLAFMGVAFTGCVEQHYYNRYHHHTREWYGRHHTPPPAGVNFDVDVR